ncbi:hypothetical protein [Janthinobacterium sp. RB2R34]|uniref:hypothetical protein n=1 Tax=Janthinobacterium sp. RB2R34 TaxID=3424193 RepID=UPI003F1F192F
MKKIWQLAICGIGIGLASTGARAGVKEGVAAFEQGRCVEAVAQLRPVAQAGNAKAQKLLGDLYKAGRDCPDLPGNDANAERWYLLAAKSGDRVAQDELVSLYLYGYGSVKNPARALPWLQDLAKGGDGGPLAQLGRLYEQGEGVPADSVLSHAYKLLALRDKKWTGAAEVEKYLPVQRNNMSPDQVKEAERLVAQWQAGTRLPGTSVTGRRSPQDWYRRAAEAGNMEAAYRLGVMYWKGIGGHDDKLAVQWLRKAAEAGNAPAQSHLAMLYGIDDTLPQDYVLASMLSQLAARGGEQKAKADVTAWERAMNPAQIAEAAQLARAWQVGTPLPQASVHGIERKVNYVRAARNKLPATPAVEPLFQAAGEGDEAAFATLLAGLPNPGDYVMDGYTLLHALILPAPSLLAYEKTWRAAHPSAREPASLAQLRKHREELRARHASLLPAKVRMMASLLARGVAVGEGTFQDNCAPLHLVALYGNAAMVRLLLAHGADVRQYGAGNRMLAPLEYALEQKEAGILPELIDAGERTALMIALLDAGSGRPYLISDERQAQAAKDKPPTGKGKGKEDDDDKRATADYLLWAPLLRLTRGPEVLDKMLATGTTPYIDDKGKSLYAYAAEVGNAGGLDWLKQRVPRHDAKGGDRWLDAAMRALYLPPAASDAVLAQLLVPSMPWTQYGPVNEESYQYESSALASLQLEPGTLLWHAVRSHRHDWVGRLASMGAPVTSDGYRPPLLVAVEDGDEAMVKLLLGLGADPLGGEIAVLNLALELPATPENNVVLDMLLRSIAARKPLADVKPSPLEKALASVTDAAGLERIRLMLSHGLPLSAVGNRAIVAAIESPQRALVPLLLEYGLLQDAEGQPRQPADSVVLRHVVRAHRLDLLPTLLDLGLDPNWRASKQMSALELAISNGDAAAVRLLLARGARIDAAADQPWGGPLDLAVASLDPATLAVVTRDGSVPLDTVCLPQAQQLLATVMGATDEYWQLLLKHGFAALPAHCTEPMAARLVTAFARQPERSLAGWLGQRFTTRLARLAGKRRQLDGAAWEQLRSAGRDDVLSILKAAGWPIPAVAAPAVDPGATALTPAQKAADLALQKRLPGRYGLKRKIEVASQIVLRADGRFSYELLYGATEEAAQGRWSVRGGELVLQGDAASRAAPFVLQAPRGGDAVDGPASVIVEYRDEPVAGIALLALGDAPQLARGVSSEQPWPVPFAGPLRHLVLSHPETGRATIALAKRRGGLLRFLVYPPPAGLRDFHAVIGIEEGRLLWDRDGQLIRYDKVK